MNERRKFIRLRTQLKVTCQVLGSDEPLSTLTRNVGGGGMSIFTRRRLPAGTILGVQVFFPGRIEPVRCTGEVIWSGALIASGPSGESGGFETGLRFLDIAPEHRELLLAHAATTPLA